MGEINVIDDMEEEMLQVKKIIYLKVAAGDNKVLKLQCTTR